MKIKTRKKVAVFLALFPSIVLFMCFDSFAANVYVDSTLSSDITSGCYSIDSRNNNGSDGNAYRTVAAGVSALTPGDTLFLRGGTYHETAISLNNKTEGSAGNKYTMKSYPGEWAIIDGQHAGSGDHQSIFHTTSDSDVIQYWVFENMEITGGGKPTSPPIYGSGIHLYNARHCEFRYLYVHDNYGLCARRKRCLHLHRVYRRLFERYYICKYRPSSHSNRHIGGSNKVQRRLNNFVPVCDIRG